MVNVVSEIGALIAIVASFGVPWQSLNMFVRSYDYR